MAYTNEIEQLYEHIVNEEEQKFSVNHNNFRQAAKLINEAYSRNRDWQSDDACIAIDYDDPANRCAYLHKYAMIHSGLMCEILQTIFRQADIHNEMKSKKQPISLCSLGVGPGIDIVSFLFVLQEIFGYVECNVNVINGSLEWGKVFESIIKQLRTGQYGDVKDMVVTWWWSKFAYEYHCVDLQNTSYFNCYSIYRANKLIKNADIVTMIKFISAIACSKTKAMVKGIFEAMKPGGMLLFVDNAAGGFDKVVRETARECGMATVFGPVRHYDYENLHFNAERHGHVRQFKTKVSIEMWRKPPPSSYDATEQLTREYRHGPRRATSGQTYGSSENIIIGEDYQRQNCCH